MVRISVRVSVRVRVRVRVRVARATRSPDIAKANEDKREYG